MIKSILYSQNENVIKDDYFVINGILENDNVSNLSLEAFQIIKSTENWKEIYNENNIVIKQKDGFLNIKSHYINKDETGRFIFYVYYVNSNIISDMLDNLIADSALINKEIKFDKDNLLSEIKKKRAVKYLYLVVVVVVIMLFSFLIWKTIE